MQRKVLLSVLVIGAMLASCRKHERQPVSASEAMPVKAAVIRIEAQAFAATVAVTGTLVSNARVDVKAETTGRLASFPRQEGDRVEAGEAVAWVDDENYKLALRQAESAVQVAEAAVERARVLEAHNHTELERAQNLVQSGGITEKDLKSALVADRDARAQAALAMAQRDQAVATLEVARKRLRDTAIRAPVAGEIQKKFLNAGAYVEPTTAVFTLVDNRRLELESPVPSADLAPIRPGQKVTFSVNAYPGESFEGRVIEVNPAVEADTRAAKVRIGVNNPGGKLKTGLFAQGEILTGIEKQAVVIPSSAVYRSDRAAKESFVFAVQDGRAIRRPVRIGHERDSSLEIVDGLKPGDLLITEQSVELAEGVRVEPVR